MQPSLESRAAELELFLKFGLIRSRSWSCF